MAWILILGASFLIYYEQNSKLWALIIFILSGFIGISTLNLPLNEPLLPLLSGLFGSSTLIYSISQKTKIPAQKITKINLNKKELVRPVIATSIISPICAFLPGLGSSQAAVLSSQFTGKQTTPNQFLFLVGSVSIIVMILSFPVLYILNKSRTGSAAAINEIINLSKSDLVYILIAVLISALISFYLALKISKLFAKSLPKLNYSLISIIVLIILSSFVLFISGFLGFLVYLVSTLLGLLAIETQIRKSSLMGCLLIPTILYYLPF
jgi:putative membrane protein